MGMLSGLKVLDFTTLLPGPYATMMLADMGAEVVKVEAPHRQDLTKYMAPMDGEVSALYGQLNRSKQSLGLDLKNDDAKEIIYKLIEEYDIVIEQFRPGVMDRLGVGYEKLKEINPKVIFCSITGYGQTGPMKLKAGHDINYLSISGISSYSAKKGEAPVIPGVQFGDIGAGSMPAVIGILSAVYRRSQTGEGQAIDVSITDNLYAYNVFQGSSYLAGGEHPEPESLLLNGGTFYDFYETKDKRYFSVGSLEAKFQEELCELIGDPELIKLSSSTRVDEQNVFKQKVRDAFKEKTFDEWLELLKDDFDGCIEPVLKFSETVDHPQIKERELIVQVEKENGETREQLAFPIKFSKDPATYRFTGVTTGKHTEEILENIGYSAKEIEAFSSKGIFG